MPWPVCEAALYLNVMNLLSMLSICSPGFRWNIMRSPADGPLPQQTRRKLNKHCNSVPPQMNSQCLRSWEAWAGIFRMRARKQKRGPDVSRMCPRLARGFAISSATVFGQQFRGWLLHSLFQLSRVRPAGRGGLRAAPSCRGRKPTPGLYLKQDIIEPLALRWARRDA